MPRRYSRKAAAGRLLEEGIRLKEAGDPDGAPAACAQAARLRRDGNPGIAATALGERDAARRAWRRYGLPLAGGGGPVDCLLARP